MLCVMIVRQKPPTNTFSSQGEFQTKCIDQAPAKASTASDDAACLRHVGTADEVADPEPDEPGVRGVAPDAADQPAHEEEVPDDVRSG